MEFNRESEVRELEKQFNDSIELQNFSTRDKKGEKPFNPFKVKYESTRDEKIYTVEQELTRLKEMQSKVLGIQETLEETIDKEVKKTREKEIRDIKNKYKVKILEIESLYREKEKRLKQEYENRIEKVMERLKEKAKETIRTRVNEEVEQVKKAVERRVLEQKLRDKAVIDKLSQMYIDLKEKYKREVQKIRTEKEEQK